MPSRIPSSKQGAKTMAVAIPPPFPSLPPSSALFSSCHAFSVNFVSPPFSSSIRRRGVISGASSRTGWQEYDDAVREKDLQKALKFLESLDIDATDVNAEYGDGIRLPLQSSSPEVASRAVADREREWAILDACINADNMMLVRSAYSFLHSRGFLPNFGKSQNVVLEGPRDVTPAILKSLTGLEASKLSPKKWGLSGSSSVVLVAFLGGTSFLLSQGIDIRPNLAVALGLAFIDSIFLGGCCLAQISCLWPPYRRRVLVHEAGHLLTAYLLGCPVRSVILDPIVAMQMGIQGQAGTQFWDEGMEKELLEGKLTGPTFDRYCMVLFAGIAAEALVYGDAEGGENDENLFRSVCVLLQPPLNTREMSNQARWAVQQSYNLLKRHKLAHRAAFRALESRQSLGIIIKKIEEAIM